MATITFSGPDPTGQNPTSTTVLTVPDEVLLLAVQAACALFGYQPFVPDLDEQGQQKLDAQHTPLVKPNPEGPGTFAIWRTFDVWKQWTIQHQSTMAKQAAVQAKLQELAAFEGTATIESVE